MKELKNLEAIRELLASHLIYTYDYSDGLLINKGADDQYYDYSPSQVEAIIFGIPQLTPEHQDYIITGLKTHLREFIQDEEQDEDMISQYTATYNALEKWESDKRETQLFDSLAALELIRQLNK